MGGLTVDLMKATDRQRETDTQKYKEREWKLKRGRGRENTFNPSAVCRLVISNQPTSTIGGVWSVTF